MLDIKRIRENPEDVKARLRTRNANYDNYIDEILEIDAERRKISTETDALKAEQNKVTKQIPVMKKNGENTDALMAEMKEISAKIKAEDVKISELEAKQKQLCCPFLIFRAILRLWERTTAKTWKSARTAFLQNSHSSQRDTGISARI